MGLVVYWYDFICFGIVGASFLGALYVIWRNESASSRNCLEDIPLPPHGGTEYISSVQLWTSCWSGLHPLWLFGLRFVSLVVLSGFLVWDIIVYDASIFVYYTEWAFTLVIIYFAIGTIISGHGCLVYYYYYSDKSFYENEQTDVLLRRDIEVEDNAINTSTTHVITPKAKEIRRSSSIKLIRDYRNQSEALVLLQQRAGFWGCLMQTLYQTCAGAVVLTDIVFWAVIVPFMSNTHFQLNLLMGCMHTVNAVFLLLDTAVNSLPFPWFRLAYFVVLSCCYVVFQWVIHAFGYSLWPYPFLVLSSPWAPLGYLCLAVVHIPCYGLYWLIVRAKSSILGSRFFSIV